MRLSWWAFGQLQNALQCFLPIHQLMRMCGPIETKMAAG
jgi:hypothetical protein